MYSSALDPDVLNCCTGPSQSRTSRLLHLVPQMETVAWWEQLSVPSLQFLYLKVQYDRYWTIWFARSQVADWRVLAVCALFQHVDSSMCKISPPPPSPPSPWKNVCHYFWLDVYPKDGGSFSIRNFMLTGKTTEFVSLSDIFVRQILHALALYRIPSNVFTRHVTLLRDYGTQGAGIWAIKTLMIPKITSCHSVKFASIC